MPDTDSQTAFQRVIIGFTVKSTEEADAENMALDAAGVPPVPSEDWLENWLDAKAGAASERHKGRLKGRLP